MKPILAISPCPNDTFIFEHLIATNQYKIMFEDIETLNTLASEGLPDIVKLSYAHFFSVANQYQLLRCGGALGRGVGPLLVCLPEQLTKSPSTLKTAIPGQHTTAHFLLQFAYPDLLNKQIIRFDQIEDAILDKQVDAGLLIHENRFTYADKGLCLIQDLGAYWEQQTGLPIPLGGIAVKRSMPELEKKQIESALRQSIEKAFEREEPITAFIQLHAQAMEKDVMLKHIDLYVNEYSMDIKQDGMEAIRRMQNMLLPDLQVPLFFENR